MTLASQFGALHEQAIAITGLDDFGGNDYVLPMTLLLSNFDHHRFNALAREMTGGAVTGMLAGRLLAQKALEAYPEFTDAAIEKPIIILGIPRTGSTSLHRLMAQDPDLQWLPFWLSNAPTPRPARKSWESNPGFKMSAAGLNHYYQIYPVVKRVHPMSPEAADECRFILGHTFWSPPQVSVGAFDEYSDWVFSCDTRAVYAYHRKMLGLIAGGDTRRFLLKDPTSHPFALSSLLEAYPDAYIVYTHRDPLAAMSSVSSMVYSIRRQQEPGLTSEQHGREQLALWGLAARKLEAALGALPSDRVCDVHVSELGADPVGVVERIYRHFKLPVSDAARAAWHNHANTDARGGHATHSLNTENWGFNESDVYAAVGSYGASYQQKYRSIMCN